MIDKINNIEEEIEDKVIDYINSDVGGRLIITKPEKALFGADLFVERRAKYKEKGIYFQINSLVVPAKDKVFVKDFMQENFKADKSFYLLFIYFDDVKQKINDYAWLVPSLQFQDIAEAITLPNKKKILRFQSPYDFKTKNKYSKFIIDIRELGILILDALEKSGKFNLKKMGLGEKTTVNLENLKDFICNARKNTYASGASPASSPRLLSSKQLEFQKGDYYYRDIYFLGGNKFIGQEIVYQESKPVWGMNYMGSVMGKLETSFLKEALLKLADKCNFGGVCEYKKREYKYQDNGQGNLAEFSGSEGVFLNGKSIYKLDYQGGLISDKI